MTLKTILHPYEQEIRQLVMTTQIGEEPKKFILDDTYWSNEDNRFQLIANDYKIKELQNDNFERDGWDPSKLIIRIDYKDNTLKLSELFLTQHRKGTATQLINLLIQICEENNIPKFEVWNANEKSGPLCEKLGLTKESDSNNYFIHI